MTPCAQLFTCVLPAYVDHTVCLSTCVCHPLCQFGDAKSPHTPCVVQMVDAQSFENCTTDRACGQLRGPREQQAAEDLEVLVRSDHPTRKKGWQAVSSWGAMIERSTTLPLPPAGEPKKRCSEAAVARPPVCRTLEQSEIRDGNFRVLASGRESKRSRICRRSLLKK